MVDQIIAFLEANPALIAVLAGLLAELVRRFMPTKDKASLMELFGRLIRVMFDFAKLPNKEKK